MLLTVYLCSFQEFRQVLKLPTLVEHFVKHTLTDNDFSVADFIKHHYLSGNVVDNDFEQDMKLPFKTMDFSTSSPNVFILNKPIIEQIEQPKKLFIEKKSNFFYKKDFISEFQFSIFQPPEFLM